MNMPALQGQSIDWVLKVTSGPYSGHEYNLVDGQISIGRSAENDIVLASDPKTSRRHAIIEYNNGQITISNISEKNIIEVDGQTVTQSILQSGTTVRIGESLFELHSLSDTAQPIQQEPETGLKPVQAAPEVYSAPEPIDNSNQWVDPSASQYAGVDSTQEKKTGGRLRFYIIIGVIGLLFYFLLSSPEEKTEDTLKIRTSEEIMKENEASRSRQKAISKARSEKGKNTRQYDEAQSSYLRCFRDYKQGQYSRAIQYCQAALSLYKDHRLAEQYRRRAIRKRDEQIQILLQTGRRNHKSGYYKRCMAALKTVMYDIRDPKNIIFQEAKELYSECHSLSEGRF